MPGWHESVVDDGGGVDTMTIVIIHFMLHFVFPWRIFSTQWRWKRVGVFLKWVKHILQLQMNESGLNIQGSVIWGNLEIRLDEDHKDGASEMLAKNTTPQRWDTYAVKEGVTWSKWHQVWVGCKQPCGVVGEGPCWLYRPGIHLLSIMRDHWHWQI